MHLRGSALSIIPPSPSVHHHGSSPKRSLLDFQFSAECPPTVIPLAATLRRMRLRNSRFGIQRVVQRIGNRIPSDGRFGPPPEGIAE